MPALSTTTDASQLRCEALAWLSDPVNPGRIALNRFSGDEDMAFVKKLYALGATTVCVAIARQFAVPIADTLIVVLPDNPQQRRALLDLAETEARLDGFDAGRIEDDGQQELGFWWD